MTAPSAIIVAYYFPPLAGIASDRAAALAELLPGAGWKPVVVTARNGFYHRAPDVFTGRCEVVRTESFELSRVLRAAYSALSGRPEGEATATLAPLDAGRAGSRLRGLVREFVYVPDAQLGWAPFAALAAARAVRRASGARVLWSTSVPYSAHLAAMWVAHWTGAPWVAEFRDPWSTAHPLNRPRSRIRRRVDLRIERRILRAAGHVVVLAQSTRRALLDRHPDLPPGKVSVVTNGFVSLPAGSPPSSTEPMSILYAGIVAPGERTEPLLSVLDRVHARRRGSFRLVILGPPDRWRDTPDGGADRPWLELRGVVSPLRAREEMRRSSVLLLIQRHDAYRIVLPGKSFEYIGSRRPILASVPEDWELAEMLRTYADVRLVGSEDPRELTQAVDTLIDEHQAGALEEPRVSEELISPLRRSEQARKLASIFSGVWAERG